jgi:hypothetical protein
MHQLRPRAAGLLLGLLAAVVFAGNTLAVTPEQLFKNDPLPMDPFIDTEECPGLSILNEGDITRSRTLYYDQDGNESRMVILVRYRLWFTNIDNGITLTTAGSRHIEIDFVNGTWTETGLYRNVTAPGEGSVLHVSGRSVEDLETAELLHLAGPHEDVLQQFCPALAG